MLAVIRDNAVTAMNTGDAELTGYSTKDPADRGELRTAGTAGSVRKGDPADEPAVTLRDRSKHGEVAQGWAPPITPPGPRGMPPPHGRQARLWVRWHRGSCILARPCILKRSDMSLRPAPCVRSRMWAGVQHRGTRRLNPTRLLPVLDV
jgi:hypothetical protein